MGMRLAAVGVGPMMAALYASQVFQRFLEQSKDRLARGAQLRAAMAAQIAAGLNPPATGPSSSNGPPWRSSLR